MKKIYNLIKTYFLILIIFLISMIAVYSIPNDRATLHVRESVEQFKTEGLYPSLFLNTLATRLDNYTDSIMLNMAVSGDAKKPIYSAMNSTFTIDSDREYPTPIDNLSTFVESGEIKKESYSRYWHGYVLFLKPLLSFFTYNEIRFLNMCMMMTLFTIVCILLNKELGLKYTLCFVGTMLFVMFPIIPMSLQFSSVFYIMLLAMIYILIRHRYIYENKKSMEIFFLIGAITSFMDFLTAPLVTLGIPLVTYLILISNKEEISFKKNFIELIISSIIWALGYLSIWASKWILASLILNKNIIKDAIMRASLRTSSTLGNGYEASFFEVIELNLKTITSFLPNKIFIIIIVLILVLTFIFRKKTKLILKNTPILIVSIMPIILYGVLKNHSGIHFWFTFRNLSVSLFSLSTFFMSSTDFAIIKTKIKKFLAL